jgi:hypothetical protein
MSRWMNDATALKESRRQTDVLMALMINDSRALSKFLNNFIQRIDELLAKLELVRLDSSKYFMEETNFPIKKMISIESLLVSKLKSYYLLNKLLWIDLWSRNANDQIAQMENFYRGLLKKNEFLVSINADKREQKETYKANLIDFRANVKSIKDDIDGQLRILFQIKIYTLKLMGSYQFFYLWKYERVDFKFFRDYKEMKKYNREFSCLDRIDKMIDLEVETQINSLKPL